MKISIVIPNYNGESLLKKNLPSLISAIEEGKKKDQYSFEVIIVDDGSVDRSVEQLEELQKKNFFGETALFYFLINGKNQGFSTTVNLGARSATGEIIILLNTDVRPEPGFFHHLLKHFQNREVFAVTCLEKSVENGKIVERGRGIGEWRKGFLYHSLGNLHKAHSLWASGGSSAFRKDIWDKLGGMNEIYNPFYWEDIDISYRALKAGFSIAFEKESIVIHEHEKGAIRTTRSKREIQVIAYRNQMLFVWLNASDATLILAHLFWLPYHIAKAFLNRDSAFFVGLTHALIRLPYVLSFKTKRLLKNKKSDREVIKEFRE